MRMCLHNVFRVLLLLLITSVSAQASWLDYDYVVMDSIPPVFTGIQTSIYPVDNNCVNGNVVLTNIATDMVGDCDSDTLKWEIYVDTWGDGVVNQEYSSYLSSEDMDFDDGEHPNDDDNDNGIPDEYISPTFSGETISITIPETIAPSQHNHIVVWKVTDGCGNVSSMESTFLVVDNSPPTPICNSLATVALFSSEEEIWAIDLVIAAFDNCTEEYELKYSFKPNLIGLDEDKRSTSRFFDTPGFQNCH